MKAQAKKKTGVMEFTVTIRIKPERQEWFSRMSDQLGLTREQAVSAMLESNMEADSNGFGEDEARMFIAEAASELYPERKSLSALSEAYRSIEESENAVETAKGAALSELFDLAPLEMGVAALNQTKLAVLRASQRSRKGKAVGI